MKRETTVECGMDGPEVSGMWYERMQAPPAILVGAISTRQPRQRPRPERFAKGQLTGSGQVAYNHPVLTIEQSPFRNQSFLTVTCRLASAVRVLLPPYPAFTGLLDGHDAADANCGPTDHDTP